MDSIGDKIIEYIAKELNKDPNFTIYEYEDGETGENDGDAFFRFENASQSVDGTVYGDFDNSAVGAQLYRDVLHGNKRKIEKDHNTFNINDPDFLVKIVEFVRGFMSKKNGK